jgi:5-methylcytosine-specific restriction endonuclease McrA
LEYSKNYYEENKEHILKQAKLFRKENKEILYKQKKKYIEANKEKVAERARQYWYNNKESFSQKGKKYRIKNKEREQERHKRYYMENPHIYRQAGERRRAKAKKLPYTLTIEEWNDIKLYFDNSCAYCGMTEEKHLEKFNEILHQEHFIALSNGGEYTCNNIIPACRSCNSSKNNKDFFEWYPKQEFYSSEREEKIMKFLNYKSNDMQHLSII